MQEELQKCGASHAELIWVDGSHNDMSTKPFNVDRLEWMLRQKRGNSGGDDTPPSYVPEKEDKEEKKEEKKDGDKKEEAKNDRAKVDLSPSTDDKDSTAHKQFSTDLENKDKENSSNNNDSSSSSPVSPPSSSDNTNVPASSDSSPSSSSPPSSGKCKAKRRQRKRAASSKRSLGEEGYAHPGPVRRGVLPIPESSSSVSQTVKRGLSLAAIVNDAEEIKFQKREAEDVQKRTPLQNLKAHAGSRRSHNSWSTNVKVSRRASR